MRGGVLGAVAHRLPLRLELLRVPRQLRDDLGREVLGDDLMLAGIVVQLVERQQEGSAESVPGDREETRSQGCSKITDIITSPRHNPPPPSRWGPLLFC